MQQKRSRESDNENDNDVQIVQGPPQVVDADAVNGPSCESLYLETFLTNDEGVSEPVMVCKRCYPTFVVPSDVKKTSLVRHGRGYKGVIKSCEKGTANRHSQAHEKVDDKSPSPSVAALVGRKLRQATLLEGSATLDGGCSLWNPSPSICGRERKGFQTHTDRRYRTKHQQARTLVTRNFKSLIFKKVHEIAIRICVC